MTNSRINMEYVSFTISTFGYSFIFQVRKYILVALFNIVSWAQNELILHNRKHSYFIYYLYIALNSYISYVNVNV